MISQLFLLFWVIAGTPWGLGLGFPDDNPPTGLGSGRVLARPRCAHYALAGMEGIFRGWIEWRDHQQTNLIRSHKINGLNFKHANLRTSKALEMDNGD